MSLHPIRVANVDAIPVAVIRRVARPAELAKVVPAGCGTAWSFLKAHGVKAGHNIAIYWTSEIRVEAGVELLGPLPADNEVVRSATPAGRAVSVAHFGPYQQLGTAHEAIRQWCAANNERPSGPNWEVYGHWQDEWNADPSLIRTDVFYQLD